MQDGYYRVINDIITLPQMSIKQYMLQQSYNLSNLANSKQIIEINLSDELVLSFCNNIQKKYFYKDLSQYDQDFFDKIFIEKMKNNESYQMFDLIEYFGTLNLFKISFEFLYLYKKYNLKTCKCTVYALEKSKNIPQILKAGKIIKNIPQFNIIKNEKIKYSFFNNIDYFVLNPCQTGFQYNTYILACNIPYEYYIKAIHLSDAICCYDLDINNYWFANSSKNRFISLINDIKTNGIKEPIALKINGNGQFISSEDCNLRTLIAIYLKLPYIPAIIYNTPQMTNQQKLIPPKNLIKQANALFNPYFFFN